MCQPDTTEHHSFWANTDQDERHMWQQFLDMVTQYPDAPIYHYGSYEPRALTILAKRYQTDAESIINRLVNVNRYIYGKVYFPVRSNKLKEIGNFIGVKWTSQQASGLQSLVWRHHWEKTQDAQYREVLVAYNREDCQALRVLTDELSKIQYSADTLSEVDFADKRKRQTTETSEQIHSQFRAILKFSHFDYDKKKISFLQENSKERAQERKELTRRHAYQLHKKLSETKRKTKKVIHLPQRNVCPQCGFEPLQPTMKKYQQTIVDIILTKNGIKKNIADYVGGYANCPTCHKTYSPYIHDGYKKVHYRTLFGRLPR